MISVEAASLIEEIEQLIGRLEQDTVVDGSVRPVLDDIRTMRRDLDTLEREVLETREREGLLGDAC